MTALLLACALALGPSPVEYRTYAIPGPNQVHVLKVDLSQPDVELLGVTGFDQLRAREQPSSIGRRLAAKGLQVLAVVNADFGETKPGYGGPHNANRGMLVRDGELLVSPGLTSSLYVTQSGEAGIGTFSTALELLPTSGELPLKVDFLNKWHPFESAALYHWAWGLSEERPENLGEVIFTAIDTIRPNGESMWVVRDVLATRGGIPLPTGTFALQMKRDSPAFTRFKSGQRWTLRTTTTPNLPLRMVISGGPRIVRDGRISVENALEGIPDDFATARHPRTAYGLSRDGKTLILLVVDGRQPEYSVGMTLEELAKVMLDNGAFQALNMDGGGSSTMVVDGNVVNRVSDASGERTTTSSLAVVIRPN